MSSPSDAQAPSTRERLRELEASTSALTTEASLEGVLHCSIDRRASEEERLRNRRGAPARRMEHADPHADVS